MTEEAWFRTTLCALVMYCDVTFRREDRGVVCSIQGFVGAPANSVVYALENARANHPAGRLLRSLGESVCVTFDESSE